MDIESRLNSLFCESNVLDDGLFIASIYEESGDFDRIESTAGWLDKVIEAIESWQKDIAKTIDYKLKPLRKVNRERLNMHRVISFYDVNGMTDIMKKFIASTTQTLDKWFDSIWNKKEIPETLLNEINRSYNKLGSDSQRDIKAVGKTKIKVPIEEAYKFVNISLSSSGECTGAMKRFFTYIKGLSAKIRDYGKSISSMANMGRYNSRVSDLKQILNSSIFMVQTAYTTIVKNALSGISSIK